MRSVSWLMMMAAHSRSLFHKSGHSGVQCRNKSVTESVSPDLWTVVNLWAALLQTAPTLANLRWPWLSADAVGSPGVAGGSALFSFSTSSLFIPFSPFPTCLEIASLPPSLARLTLTHHCRIFVFGRSDSKDTRAVSGTWFGYKLHPALFLLPQLIFSWWHEAWFGFGWWVSPFPPCSWLVCRLCFALCVVLVVLQFKSCAVHFILIWNWDVFCAVMCVSFFFFWSCRTVDLPSLLPLMVSADIF